MKTKLLFCVFLLATQAFAQWSDFCSQTQSSILCGAMNGKLNFRTGSGAPTAVAGTQGKDVYIDLVTNDMYQCTATGSPATWAKLGLAVAGTGLVMVNSGTPGVAVAGTDYPGLGSANAWTGYNDMSAASWRPPESVFGSLPAASTVSGRVYIVTNSSGPTACDGAGSSRSWCRSNGTTYEVLGGSGGGAGGTICSVTVGATPAMDATSCNGTPGTYISFKLGPLAQNASPTFSNGIAGREYAIEVYQGASTPFTVTWPGNMPGGCDVDPGLGNRTVLTGVMDSTGSNLLIKSCAYIDQASTIISGRTRSAPSTPAAGNLSLWFDSTDNTVEAKNSSGTVFKMQSAASSRRPCTLVVGGDTLSVALQNSDLSQARWCYLPYGATIVEIMVSADAGTPNVIVGRNHAGTVSNLTSAALATAAAGALACSNVGGTTGFDATTTCSATLQNTSISSGDWLDLVSGTAGGTAKRMTISVTYTVN
jgi:hypothetical protein